MQMVLEKFILDVESWIVIFGYLSMCPVCGLLRTCSAFPELLKSRYGRIFDYFIKRRFAILQAKIHHVIIPVKVPSDQYTRDEIDGETAIKENTIDEKQDYKRGTIWIKYRGYRDGKWGEWLYRRFTFTRSENYGMNMYDGDFSDHLLVPEDYTKQEMETYIKEKTNLDNPCTYTHLGHVYLLRGTGYRKVAPDAIWAGKLAMYILETSNKHETLSPATYNKLATKGTEHSREHVNPFYRGGDPSGYLKKTENYKTSVDTMVPDTQVLSFFANLDIQLVHPADAVDKWSGNY